MGLVLGLTAVALVLSLIAIMRLLGARRAMSQRVAALAVRLHPVDATEQAALLPDALVRLEEAVAHAASDAAASATAEARLVQALDVLHQGVVVCDEKGRIRYRNRLAEAFAGARHSEALAEQATAELLQAALGGEAAVRPVDLYGPPRRNLEVTAVPLTAGGGIVGAAAVIEDVSNRRRLEAVRRDFVANVSHELKTPVGALGLLAETLVDEDDPAVIRRLAERMQAESSRVGRIIHDLLDLSRLEAEESPVREPVAVHLVVAQAVEQVRPAAELHSVAVNAGDVPRRLTILGDRRQLISALYNLLENAVKYSESGGAVEIECVTDGRAVRLSVRDHGIGIPARDFERIFERFYRVDRGRSRDTGGTGLGLAIVRHVATNHGGDVSVASREGDGSTFTLQLPAGPGPVALTSYPNAHTTREVG
jgi:two-component system sensor histidine kinase SenX3